MFLELWDHLCPLIRFVLSETYIKWFFYSKKLLISFQNNVKELQKKGWNSKIKMTKGAANDKKKHTLPHVVFHEFGRLFQNIQVSPGPHYCLLLHLCVIYNRFIQEHVLGNE